MAMLRKTRIPAQLFLLFALVLLPALSYTAYELFRLGESEEQIAALYERQMDAILFSVNQYAWDIGHSWINALAESARRNVPAAVLPEALAAQRSLRFAAVLDSTLQPRIVLPGRDGAPTEAEFRQLADSLQARKTVLRRIERFRRSGYGKIEAILLPGNGDSPLLALVASARNTAPASDRPEDNRFHVLCLDTQVFIVDIFGPKFRDLASAGDFVLACTERVSGRIITSTGTDEGTFHARRTLWLFPDYTIAIRLAGSSIEELARSRSRTSIILLSAVGMLLLAGAWLLYRNFRRELQLADMKTDFVSNVSHELKTPLALIRMYAETLEMGRIADTARRQEYLGTIVRETDRLTRLINNILTFSRIEAGHKEYRKAPVDINLVVSDIVGVYRFHLEHQGFHLHVDTADGLPLFDGDEEALAEAVLNLLDNAMKYSGDGRDIAIRTGADNGEIWVEIEDHGIGIPETEQKNIYDKFFRVSDGLVHTAKGSGLGLALVRHIVHAHDGRIELRSAVGEGSRFRLLFPVTPRPSEA